MNTKVKPARQIRTQQGVRRSATDCNPRFHDNSFIPALLRRGATEPPGICDWASSCLETRLPAALTMRYNPHLSTHIPPRQIRRGIGAECQTPRASLRGKSTAGLPPDLYKCGGSAPPFPTGGFIPAFARCCFCIAISLLVLTSPIHIPFYAYIIPNPLLPA